MDVETGGLRVFDSAEELQELRARGFRAFKIGWGPFGRRDAATDDEHRHAADFVRNRHLAAAQAMSALELMLAGEMERAMMKVHAKPPRPKPPRPEPAP